MDRIVLNRILQQVIRLIRQVLGQITLIRLTIIHLSLIILMQLLILLKLIAQMWLQTSQ